MDSDYSQYNIERKRISSERTTYQRNPFCLDESGLVWERSEKDVMDKEREKEKERGRGRGAI